MPNRLHDQSQELSAKALLSMRSGRIQEAHALYLQAAQLEAEALALIGADKPRTRGILAVSLVSQYYKASAYVDAEKAAYALLVETDLPGFAREQLQELLEVIWEEQQLKAVGVQYSEETIMVSLRGSEIGAGSAPINLIMDRIHGVQSLLYRIAEWRGHYPFRRSGSPPVGILEICRPLMTEPKVGSFRFGLQFVEPMQLEMQLEGISTRKVGAVDISRLLLKLVQTITPTSYSDSSAQSLEELVPDRQYRHAMLKLIRNIAPDGRRVKEVEFTRVEEGAIQDRALLHEGAKVSIANSLNADQQYGHTEEEIYGILRAVHLDRNWLEVVLPNHSSQHILITPEVLDDVVGPMVNRPVLIRSLRDRSTGQIQLIDIELDTSAETGQGR